MFLNLYFQSIEPFRAIIKSNFKKVNKLKYPFFFTQNNNAEAQCISETTLQLSETTHLRCIIKLYFK